MPTDPPGVHRFGRSDEPGGSDWGADTKVHFTYGQTRTRKELIEQDFAMWPHFWGRSRMSQTPDPATRTAVIQSVGRVAWENCAMGPSAYPVSRQ